MVSRFHVIEVEPPTVYDWTSWMDENFTQWDRRILAYLMRFQEDFIDIPSEPETLSNYPTPRTWTNLALELQDTPAKFLREKVCGYIGKAVGGKLAAFLESNIPDLEELLRNPAKFKELTLDSQYMAIVMLASYVDQEEKVSVSDLLRFLDVTVDVQGDFVVLFLLSVRNKKKRTAIYNKIYEAKSKAWKSLAEVGYLSAFL